MGTPRVLSFPSSPALIPRTCSSPRPDRARIPTRDSIAPPPGAAAAPALPEGPCAAPLPAAPPGLVPPPPPPAALSSARPRFHTLPPSSAAAAPVSFWSSKQTFIKLETNTGSTGTAFASPQGHGGRGSPGDLGARGTRVSRRRPRGVGVQGPGLGGATPGVRWVQSLRLRSSGSQCEYRGRFRLPNPSAAGPEPLAALGQGRAGPSPTPHSWPIPTPSPPRWGLSPRAGS